MINLTHIKNIYIVHGYSYISIYINPYKCYTDILNLLANSKINGLKLDELMPHSEKNDI